MRFHTKKEGNANVIRFDFHINHNHEGIPMENEEPVTFNKSFIAVRNKDLRGVFGKLHSYVEGKVIFDMKIDGLGAMQIDVKLPISQEALGALTFQQIEGKLLLWMDQTIQEQHLREWLESQSDHSSSGNG